MFILGNPFRLLSELLRVGIQATAHCSSRISNIWPISSQNVAFLFAWWARVTACARTHAHTHTHNISGEISHKSSFLKISFKARCHNNGEKQLSASSSLSVRPHETQLLRRKDFRAIFIYGFLMKIGRYIPISVTIGQITDRSLLDPWRHRHQLSSKRCEPLTQWHSVAPQTKPSTTALWKPRIRNK